jgi:integrase
MARTVNRLSPRGVETLGKPGMHADGGGLYLVVDKSGAKRWTFIYRWQGKRREMGLGGLMDVSLATARQKAADNRALVDAGKDPIEQRQLAKAAATRTPVPTFGEAADAYVKAHKAEFRSGKHFDQWVMTLSLQRDKAGELRPTGYCLTLRNKPVDKIETSDVLEVLKPIWLKVPETASRLRGRIERVLDAQRVLGNRHGENPARWRSHLDQLLPKRQKLTRGHHKAMPYADVPAFMRRLRDVRGMGARALEFLILTVGRTNEVTQASRPEFAVESGVWTVPPGRMKASREHRVPLSQRALEIAKEQIEASSSPYLFPGLKPGRPISNATMTKALAAAGGGDFTVHGLRSSFRDWVGEETGFAENVAEAAIAHVVGDETERAYRRGDALAKRRKLMQAWEDYCLSVGNVLPFSARRRRRA